MKRLVNILMVVIFAAALLPAGGAALAQEAAPAVPCTPLTGEEQSALLQLVQQEAAGQLDAAGEETLRRLREQANCFVMQPAPAAPDMVSSPDAPAAPAAAPDAPDATTTFAVISDYGTCTTSESNVATMVNDWNPDYILTAGDNDQDACTGNPNYTAAVGDKVNGTGYYGAKVKAGAFFPVPGNHDYTPSLSAYSTYFNYLPNDDDASRRYYDFVQGNVHFFMVDSPGMIDFTTEQISDQGLYDAEYAWLQDGLQRSTAAWQIVIFHFPPYSSSSSHQSMEPMRWPFATWGADAVFSGHNHVYERVMQNGIPYFTVGLGGQTINSWGTTVDGSTVRYNGNFGAMKITTTDLAMTFQFLSLGSIVQDTYTVISDSCTSVSPEASEDTYMSAYNNDYNYGGVNLLKVTDYYASIPNRGSLLKWDVGTIPSNATVASASMTVYVSTAGAKVYNLYNMKRSWVEGTTNPGASSSTSANWNTYDGVNAWGTPGAASTTADRDDTNLWEADATSFASTGSKTVALNPSGLAVLQGWINGTVANFGVTMQNYQTSGTNDDLQISSSENTTNAGPTLNIVYCVAAGPTISVNPSSLTFSAPVGVYAAEQTLSVTGSSLTEGIGVAATADFEVSLTSGSGFGSSVSLPAAGGTVYVRFKRSAAGTSSGSISLNSSGAGTKTVTLSGSAGDPAISVNPASLTFSGTAGAYSAEQSYTVTGSYLTNPIAVTAPADFEVSLTSGSGFGSSVSLPVGGGTVYVRFKRSTAGTSTGTITNISNPQADVSVTGTATTQSCQTWTVSQSSDDAEQRTGGYSPILTNTTLQMVRYISFGNRLMWWGLRFQSIAIPQGSTINSAYMTFRASGNSSASAMTWYGNDVDDATTFTTNTSDISGRTQTTASAAWGPGTWAEGTSYNTSDLSTIVQEIVDRGGWVSGNDMAFLGQTTQSTNKTAVAYDDTNQENQPSLTVCYTPPSYIGDKVWNDTDKDGVQDSGEAGLSGVIVRLFSSDGLQVGATFTNASGSYSFPSPAAGSYYVSFELPGGYTYSPKYVGGATTPTGAGNDSDVNMASGQTDVFTVAAGSTTTDIDCGMWQITTKDIGDEVWVDTDEDGLQDALGTTEFPGGPVTVRLWRVGGGVVQTTVSTRALSYGFDVDAGTYYIEFIPPSGYVFTTQNVGSDDAIDSDANAGGFTDQFTYDGTQNLTIDAGLKGQVCYTVADNHPYTTDATDRLVRYDLLTGKGYLVGTSDSTANGIESVTYDPISGRLYAYNTSTWGYLTPSTGVWTSLGSSMANQTCRDQNGNTRTVGTDGFDALAYNAVNDTWWAAIRIPESGSSNTPDVLVQINPANGTFVGDSVYTPGTATCISIAAPSVDALSADIDDMAFSSDGTLYMLANQTSGPTLPTYVTVALKNANGEYTGAITNLGPITQIDDGTTVSDVEGLSIDEYGRVFISTGTWEYQNNVDHTSIWQILNLSGSTDLMATKISSLYPASVLIGNTDGTLYGDYESIACYGTSAGGTPVTRSSLGNYVWSDANGDGVQDSVEAGVNGVVVQLYGPGTDGLFGDANDVLLATQTTVTNAGANGYYMFTNLPAGQYQVRLAASNFASGGALEGLIQTTNPVYPNADLGNQTLPYSKALPWNTVNVTADFGYARADLGDHLDGNFKTLVASNGPRHVVFPDPGNDGTPAAWGGVEAVWLGPTVDTEGNGQPSTAANGDDLAATDDEDGAAINSMTWSGLNLQLPVTVSSSGAPTGMYLAAWVDWNADGVFNSTGYYDANTCPACEMYKVAVSVGSNTLSLAAPSTFQNYDPSLEIRLRLYASDPGTPSPVGLVVNGEVEDYVRGVSPTGITLAAMSASVQGDAIEVTWDTASEVSNLGFNLYRRLSPDGPEIRLNANRIPAQGSGSPEGFHYTYLDSAGLVPGATYWYTLEDVSTAGTATRHEPVSVVYSGGPTAVSLSAFAGSRGIAPAAFAALAALAALAGLVLASAAVRRRGAPR